MSMISNIRAALTLLIAALLLAACGGGTSTPTIEPSPDTPTNPPQSPTSVFAITVPATLPPPSSTPSGRSTLPPSWTPTLSPTPTLSSTPTITPTTTLTPTITATFTADRFCEELFGSAVFLSNGITYTPAARVDYIISNPDASSTTIFEVTNQRTGETIVEEFPGGIYDIGLFDLSLFPGGYGDFTSVLYVERGDGEHLCESTKNFTITLSEDNDDGQTLLEQMRDANPTAEPTATPAPTDTEAP